ncbi:UNVERIFIED_CONTAM: hypothetical protein FKN15_050967 [Acipenser sinensis]
MEGGGPQPVSLPQPPAPLHGSVPKLPQYNGVMSLEAFLTQFEIVAEDYAWSQRKKASCLSQSLEGAAAEVLLDFNSSSSFSLYTRLRLQFYHYFNFRYIKRVTALLQALLKSPYRLQDQLRGRCRARGKKLGALAADIARLSCKAYRDEPTSFSQRIALDTFLRSLQPPELRHQVRLKRPSTLKEALGYAQSIEEVLLDEEPLPRHLTSKPVRLVEHMWTVTVFT